jgi:hypothetical protein
MKHAAIGVTMTKHHFDDAYRNSRMMSPSAIALRTLKEVEEVNEDPLKGLSVTTTDGVYKFSIGDEYFRMMLTFDTGFNDEVEEFYGRFLLLDFKTFKADLL